MPVPNRKRISLLAARFNTAHFAMRITDASILSGYLL